LALDHEAEVARLVKAAEEAAKREAEAHSALDALRVRHATVESTLTATKTELDHTKATYAGLLPFLGSASQGSSSFSVPATLLSQPTEVQSLPSGFHPPPLPPLAVVEASLQLVSAAGALVSSVPGSGSGGHAAAASSKANDDDAGSETDPDEHEVTAAPKRAIRKRKAAYGGRKPRKGKRGAAAADA